MRVLLFRHGLAGARDPERWPDDGERPLTSRGVARTRKAARGLLRLEGRLDHVFTSPLRRCTETAAILATLAGIEGGADDLDALRPRGSWREVIARVTEQSPEHTVALVGHEPDLGKLAGVLLFGAPTSLALKKAGACSIEFDGPVNAGAGHLRWFLPPRALARFTASRSKV